MYGEPKIIHALIQKLSEIKKKKKIEMKVRSHVKT